METAFLPIPKWFWEVIDGTKPDLQKLAALLETFEKEKLENYYGFYVAASHAVCEPWNGPYIDESIDHLSEDSTRDLTDWIVSQGYDFWLSIASLAEEQREEKLREAFWLEHKTEDLNQRHAGLVKWSYDVKNTAYSGYFSPGALPVAVYNHKFGEEMTDNEEEIFDRIDQLLDEAGDENDDD